MITLKRLSLIAGPLLMLAGVLLRLPFDFFFPAQLAAYADHPALMTTSYSLFLAGNVCMWPGITLLAHQIGLTRPALAAWGMALTVFGLFARTFHAGIDHLAFQVADSSGAAAATDFVGSTYGAFHVMRTFSVAIIAGWIVLAIGAYRSGVLGLARSIALGLMTALPLGVLKGTTWLSVVAVGGLCIALVPLGFRDRQLHWKAVLLIVVTTVAMFVLGQFG